MTSRDISVSGRLGTFVHSFGPAWVVMIADVDAASILTAAADGAVYGYSLVWFLLLLTLPLFLVQEAAGRIGVATGKGLGEIIRENYSRRVALLTSVPMACTDVLSYVAEFTGIAIGFQLLGVAPILSLPVIYVIYLAIVWKRGYTTVERFLVVFSIVLIVSYGGSLFLRGLPPMREYMFFFWSWKPDFLYLLAATSGAVVMPFMLFYQVSATAEKRVKSLWSSRLETLIGAIASEVGMVVILLATIGLNGNLIETSSPRQLSQALSFLAGSYAPYVFGIGLIAASFIALVVISLGSAWGVAEAIGWGRQRFFWIYLIESLPALIVPMIFPDLFRLAIDMMVLFVFVLLGPGVMVGVIARKKRIMGNLSSGPGWSVAYWMSLLLVVASGFIALAAAFN
ncbi:MAG TPA: divalent metal cation transporter [Candidatus Bathyarchaeia archaeon]|nr:divalent metal cation transporter [Candidatus Bathyarchaeia archaeon]